MVLGSQVTSYWQLLIDVVSHPIFWFPTRGEKYHTSMIASMSSHKSSPTILKDKTVTAMNMEAEIEVYICCKVFT